MLCLPLFLVITLMSALIYVCIQQEIRSSANDPQVQIGEDTISKLSAGRNAQTLVSIDMIDIDKSLSPFTIIYDNSYNVIASSALLNNHTPALPIGVFHVIDKDGKAIFTWQPADSVRVAAVVTKYNSGYVLTGRSLREVEKRESKILYYVFSGWLLTLALTFLTLIVLNHKSLFKNV